MDFWDQLTKTESLLSAGKSDNAASSLSALLTSIKGSSFYDGRLKLIQNLAERFKYTLEDTASYTYSDKNVDAFIESRESGVSLVTCCMNRNDNIVKALPSWVENDLINEILIVDWSSEQPVRKYIDELGFTSSKIRVIRINNEPRWILSYAFNLGFRLARYNTILKTDADIIIHSNFFSENILGESEFIAGDWRIAEKGQEHINGFFYLKYDLLTKVKGFNEYITTYGWDDDDIYNRLVECGGVRKAVNTETIYHIPHDDSSRFINQSDEGVSAKAELEAMPIYKIRTNKFIADVMPKWDQNRIFLPMKVVGFSDSVIDVAREGTPIHYVPEHIRYDAEYYAATEILSWRIGLKVYDLNPIKLQTLLSSKPFSKIDKGDVLAYIYKSQEQFVYDKLLTINFDELRANFHEKLIQIHEFISTLKDFEISVLILTADIEKLNKEFKNNEYVIVISIWENMGELIEFSSQSMLADLKSATYYVTSNYFDTPHQAEAISPVNRRDVCYVDAQHGLGNRLRAIGSAAAIAKATNRELVIVWESDHHCECEFSDLFDYPGIVLTKSFLSTISGPVDVFNYMEIEDGATKNQEIEITEGRALYLRAAYTFNSVHSNWDTENEFLKSLKPTDEILDLIASFELDECLAVHVRMEAGKGLDHNTYDSVTNWTQDGHDELHFWREKSHFSHFITRIDSLVKEHPETRIFLATDLQDNYDIFKSYYGDRLSYLKRVCFDRSSEQIKYALADAILLSRCRKLLGSTWSSFSELAMRLSSNYSSIEMSGRDF